MKVYVSHSGFRTDNESINEREMHTFQWFSKHKIAKITYFDW